jgi:phosphoribosyl-ATP pyrophosphohydrolase
MTEFSLKELVAIIAERAIATSAASYTKSLLEAGPARVAKKFGEEAVEAVIAAVEGDRQALICESADVFYHLLVLLQARGVALQEVLDELERRTSRSGHEEKAARTPAGA